MATAEQEVKKVHPKACAQQMGLASYWLILASPFQGGVKNELIGEAAHRESWAWADALRRIKAGGKA